MEMHLQALLDTMRHSLESEGLARQDHASGVLILSAAASIRQAVDLLDAAHEAKLKETLDAK